MRRRLRVKNQMVAFGHARTAPTRRVQHFVKEQKGQKFKYFKNLLYYKSQYYKI
jgi:hypothetical protein